MLIDLGNILKEVISWFWLLGYCVMALVLAKQYGKQPRFCRGHPQIGYCTGFRDIKTGGHSGHVVPRVE